MDGPTVAVLTLGCKLNQAESQALARELLAHGCRVTDQAAPADAFVINTCSVTHVADRKSRHLVRLARRLAPEATVVLTGCYAQTVGPDLAHRLGADIVVGNADKPAIARHVLTHLHDGGQGSRATLAGEFPLPAPKRGSIEAPIDAPAFRRGSRTSPSALAPTDGLRTRALVKIQEGCNEVCAFCVVPRTRGRERSVPIGEVVAQVLSRQAEDVKEIVLTGTQLGNYGRDLGLPPGPGELLATLLAQTAVPRLRLSSLQAQDISDELLRLWRDRRLCRHFHIPLQSGSDRILAAMRRRYTVHQYRRAVALVRQRVPDVAITTDAIVGFPGETEEDFRRTYDLCQELDFAAIHVFPYSQRPGTAAARMGSQVPPAVKQGRLERMLALARASAHAFCARFRGRTMDVLWLETKAGEGRPVWQGLTDNYLRVYTSARDGWASGLSAEKGLDLTNQLLPVRLGEPVGDGLWGELQPGG